MSGGVEDHPDGRHRDLGEPVSEAQISRTGRLQRQLLVCLDNQRQRGIAHTHSNHLACGQAGRCIAGHDHQLLRCGTDGRRLLDTEVTGDRHESTDGGLQSGQHDAGLTVENLQRRSHHHLAHSHGQEMVHVFTGVVEGDTHGAYRNTGKSITQAQVSSTSGLERQLLIATDQQGHGGVADTRLHRGADRERRRRVVGHHIELIDTRGRALAQLQSEITADLGESGNGGLQTGHGHRGHALVHLQRSAGGNRSHRHGECRVEVSPGVVVGDPEAGGRGRGESVTQLEFGRTSRLERQLLIASHQQRHRHLTHTGSHHGSGPQRGRGGIRHHPQLFLACLRSRIKLHTEVARHRHEAAHRGFEARDHHGGNTLLHHQRRTDGDVSHLQGDLAIDIDSGVVEGHPDPRGGHPGESSAQIQLGRTGRLEGQLLIVADHQRHRRILHPGLHHVTDRQRGGGIPGHHHEGGPVGRRGRPALEGEAAGQGDKVGHLGLETIDHHGRHLVFHRHRHTHIDRTNSDRHGLGHVPAGIVVGDAHTRRRNRREAAAQTEIGRSGGLEHQRLILVQNERQRGSLHTHPQRLTDRQPSPGVLGEHDQLIIIGQRTGLLLERVIAGQRDESADRGVQAGHQHGGHLIADHQRRAHTHSVGAHVEQLVQIGSRVVV